MIIALFGGDGRAVGTHAAVLLAHAAASVGNCTKLLRVLDTHEAKLPYLGKVPDTLQIVELRCDDPLVHTVLHREIDPIPSEQVALVDLPSSWLAACPVDLANHAKVVAVGPTMLDCSIAAAALRVSTHGTPPWLLACGTSSISAFDLNMRKAMVAAGLPDNVIRLIGHGLPAFTNHDTAWDASSIQAALGILKVIAPGSLKAFETPVEMAAPANFRMGQADSRTVQQRLRELADALDGLEGGGYPRPAELDAAPILDDWEFGVRPVRALVGRVTGHSDFQADKRICTSEVYGSDRRTWARTYSRLYRLGRPAGLRPDLH